MNTNSDIIVQGMSCANCAYGIKKTLEKQGFKSVNVDFASGVVQLNADNNEQLYKAVDSINDLGYVASLPNKINTSSRKSILTLELKLFISIIFTLPLLFSMFLPFELLHNSYFQLLLCIPVYTIGVLHFGRSAFYSLKSGVTNMDVLIIMGSTAAFLYSLYGTINKLGHNYHFYETTASIISIILIGNILEHKSVKKTTSAIDDLTKLQSNTAKKITKTNDGNDELVSDVEVSEIKKGNILLVNNGDKVPVDAEIIWGSALVDESLISGESIPINKKLGDNVVGGSILIDGSVKIKATSVGKDTVLSQIIELVKKAQSDKPKMQNLADKISEIFVPSVIIISVLTFVINYFFILGNFQESLLRGIAVLVISCPCALGLAIPTAVIVGIGSAASKGILVKGGSTLEKLTNIDTIVFDKTGTLTTGNFKILNIETIDISEEKVKSILLGLEKYSTHPIANSITTELASFSEWKFNSIIENKGIGIEGVDDNGDVFVINSIPPNVYLNKNELHRLYLYKNHNLIAKITIADEIRHEAKYLVKFLNKNSINTVLLSGDNQFRCKQVADELGIEKIYYEKKPTEKLAIIDSELNPLRTVMVGDGINDAPSLAKANVGISLSKATQVAITSSNIILINNKLNSIIDLLTISRQTLKIIKQNLFWAFIYNIIAIPIAASGLLNPMIAAFAMAFSDVFVVANSLRIKWLASKKTT